MNDPTVISMVVGVGVIALIGGLGFVMSKRGDPASLAEQRLDGLTGKPWRRGSPTWPAGSCSGRRPSTWNNWRRCSGCCPTSRT